jgi:uncharacterized membrane protein YkvA (DUF1232 family)
MPQQASRKSVPGGWNWPDLMGDMVVTGKLLLDPAVPIMLKLFLPVLALVYLVSPLDLIPFMPFDDIAVVLIAARLFVALSPRESVERAFGGNSASASNVRPEARRTDDADVIDTTWRVID